MWNVEEEGLIPLARKSDLLSFFLLLSAREGSIVRRSATVLLLSGVGAGGETHGWERSKFGKRVLTIISAFKTPVKKLPIIWVNGVSLVEACGRDVCSLW